MIARGERNRASARILCVLRVQQSAGVRAHAGAADSRGSSRALRLSSFVSELAHLLADLADRLLLQLANAFAAEIVLVADLFQRELVLVVEAEAPTNDAALDWS